MKSKPVSPEDELQALEKRCKLLLTGEWVTLVLSGVGTVVTAITQNAVFAATPITASLFLNILSRSHQDKRIYDQSSQNLIEIQRQYASKLQGLRSEFLGIDLSEEGLERLPANEAVEELATKVKQLESFLEIQGGDYYSQGGAINQEVSILRNHQLEMAEAIESLTAQVEGVSNPTGDHEEVMDTLARLSAAVYELEQKTALLSEESGGASEVNGLYDTSTSNHFSSQLEPIQSQLMALEERMNFMATADPAYDEESLQNSMESLMQPLYQQISAVEHQVQTQQETLQAMPEPQAEPESHTAYNEIQQSVVALQEKLEHSLNQVSGDIGDFQHSLQETHGQLGDLQNRVAAIQELADQSSNQNQSEAIQEQIERLNAPLMEKFAEIQHKFGELDQLRLQIQDVQNLAQHSAHQLNPEALQAQVQAATEPIMAKVNEVEGKIQTQAADSNIMVKLQQVIEPLQSHMVSLEQRINQLSAEGDRQPLLNKIATLQGQLQHVEARLREIPNQAVDHTAHINQLSAQIAEMQNRLDQVANQVSKDLDQIPQVIESKVQEKVEDLPDLNALTFEEQMLGKKSTSARGELDDLLDSLNF